MIWGHPYLEKHPYRNCWEIIKKPRLNIFKPRNAPTLSISPNKAKFLVWSHASTQEPHADAVLGRAQRCSCRREHLASPGIASKSNHLWLKVNYRPKSKWSELKARRFWEGKQKQPKSD